MLTWANNSIAVLDPAIAQAIATIAGAIAMLIISMASYYFPKDRDRFDEDNDDDDERPHRSKRRRR
jgi:hypothetical protein